MNFSKKYFPSLLVALLFISSVFSDDIPMPSVGRYKDFGGLDIEALFDYEQSLLVKLDKFQERVSKKLAKLTELYNRSIPDGALETETTLNDYLGSPVTAHQIITRFTKEWSKMNLEFGRDQLELKELQHDVTGLTTKLPEKDTLDSILKNVEERYGIVNQDVTKKN